MKLVTFHHCYSTSCLFQSCRHHADSGHSCLSCLKKQLLVRALSPQLAQKYCTLSAGFTGWILMTNWSSTYLQMRKKNRESSFCNWSSSKALPYFKSVTSLCAKHSLHVYLSLFWISSYFQTTPLLWKTAVQL